MRLEGVVFTIIEQSLICSLSKRFQGMGYGFEVNVIRAAVLIEPRMIQIQRHWIRAI